VFAQSIFPQDRDDRIAAVRHDLAEAELLISRDTERARHLADRAYNESEEIGDRGLVGEALRVRADARHHSGLLEGALQDASQALAIFSVIHERRGQAESLRLLGTIETQLGNFHDATLYFEEGRDLALAGSYQDLLARFNYSLAVAHYRLLQPHEALAPAREFLQAADDMDAADRLWGRTLMANLCFMIAEQQTKRGRAEEARGSVEEALNYAREAVEIGGVTSPPEAMVEAWGTLAKAQALLGLTKKGAASLDKLNAAMEECDSALVRARGDLYRADIQAALGDSLSAIQFGMESLATFKRVGSTVEVCETLGRLAEFCERVGDIRAAFDYYKRYRDLDDELRTRAAERRSQILGRKLELEKARHEAELLKLRSEFLSQQNQTLQKMADKHLEDALHDQLTGLPNRRAFDKIVQEIESGQIWNGLQMSVAVCDIDHFKLVNDRHGHAVGDDVLKHFAAILEKAVRQGDFVARIGGEEFVILMRGVKGSSAIGACERIRTIVEKYNWAVVQPDLRLTTCIGVAWSDEASSVEALMEKADQSLYDAKRAGRNRVCFTAHGQSR
jgi:diguanylate cyclase (GGDEF)-like protein